MQMRLVADLNAMRKEMKNNKNYAKALKSCEVKDDH
jgi:hypothetical protein